MIFDKVISDKTVSSLLEVNAIKLKPNKPFTWASGWKSPIYCDNRIILSYKEVRDFIASTMAEQVKKLYGNPDAIAGVATGAIGIGMLVADRLGLPFIYVRPEAKSHGRQNQIEGSIESGKSVVVIEDLISTGKSSLNAVNALKKAEVDVLGMIAIFSYGFDIAVENFKNANIKLNTLSNYRNLLALAKETNYISSQEHEVLKLWNSNPSEWGK